MHDEPAVGLHGSAAQHRPIGKRGPIGACGPIAKRAGFDRDIQLRENLAHAHLQGLVQDQAQRTAGTVVADQRDGLRKIRVAHRGHRDQQLVRQVSGLIHGSEYSTLDPCEEPPRNCHS